MHQYKGFDKANNRVSVNMKSNKRLTFYDYLCPEENLKKNKINVKMISNVLCHISMERSRQDEQLDAITFPLALMGAEIKQFLFPKWSKLTSNTLFKVQPSTCYTSKERS